MAAILLNLRILFVFRKAGATCAGRIVSEAVITARSTEPHIVFRALQTVVGAGMATDVRN